MNLLPKILFCVLAGAAFAQKSDDQAEVRMHGELRKAFREPPLAKLPADSAKRVYRMMITPTWGRAFSLRIESNAPNSDASIVVKHLRWDGSLISGNLVEEEVTSVPAKDFRKFETLIAKSGYEKMGLSDPDQGLDGETWWMEGAGANFYHIAARWCPNDDARQRRTKGFVAACRWLADRAKATERITNKGHPVFER